MFRTLTPVLSIIISIVLIVFYVKPKYLEIKEVRSQTQQYKLTTEQYTSFNARVQDLLDKKNKTELSDKERLDVLLPSVLDPTLVLVDLEALAKRNGMLFGNIKVDDASEGAQVGDVDEYGNPIETQNTLKTTTIGFGVIGTYTQFKEFLRALESSLTLMEVTSISILPGVESQFQQFALEIQVYSQDVK